MGRQQLGAAKKSKIISTRLTPREHEVLSRRYGSPGTAFRGFVNTIMDQEEREYVQRLNKKKADQ